jgi:tetratricopeptide (TPR) repeat protein
MISTSTLRANKLCVEIRPSFFYFLIIFLVACKGSGYYTKLGKKQEEGGLLKEASASYYTAVQKKRDNIDAQLGLKRAGQHVLNGMLLEFAHQKSFGTSKAAVESFEKATQFKSRIQGVGVNLDIPEMYVQDFNSSKDNYLHELYSSGSSLLEEGKFDDAKLKFDEIKRLQPDFKDAKDLGNIAYMEPLYQKGLGAMELAHYREAYDNFLKVVNTKSAYKDSKELLDECLLKGRYSIAMIAFQSTTGSMEPAANVSAYALSGLLAIKDPFLKIVDRSSMDDILKEQKLQLSGSIDASTAVQVGEITGAQALLTGNVLSHSNSQGNLRSLQKNGFAAYQEKLKQPDGKFTYQTRYRPVLYTEYYQENASGIGFQYKLIDLHSGQIITTDVIRLNLKDEVLYVKYDGDPRDLYPAGVNGGPNLSVADKRALLGLCSAGQEIKSTQQLSREMFESVGNQVANAVAAKMKEIVK